MQASFVVYPGGFTMADVLNAAKRCERVTVRVFFAYVLQK